MKPPGISLYIGTECVHTRLIPKCMRRIYAWLVLFSGVLGVTHAQDWTLTNAPGVQWISAALSADTKTWVASGIENSLRLSTDGGLTWWQTNLAYFRSVCCSADGQTI